METDRVVSAGAAARILHVSKRTIERWCKDATLTGIRTAGGHWRIYRASIERFLNPPTATVAA